MPMKIATSIKNLTKVFRPEIGPLQFIVNSHQKLLNSPRREYFFNAFDRAYQKHLDWKGQNRIDYSSETETPSYLEDKSVFINKISGLLKSGDNMYSSWASLTKGINIDNQLFHDFKSCELADENNVFESDLIYNLMKYMGHDGSWTSPKVVPFHLQFVFIMDQVAMGESEMHVRKSVGLSIGRLPALDISQPYLNLLQEAGKRIDKIFDYYEEIPGIGRTFFASDDVIRSLRTIKGCDLEEYINSQFYFNALRFFRTNFKKVDDMQSAAGQNSFMINVDPDLRDMELPLIYVMSKIACNIKNIIRIVDNQVFSDIARIDSVDPRIPLMKGFKGETLEQPILVSITAKKHTDDVWELAFCDNGDGILTHKLFGAVAKAYKIDKDSIPVKFHTVIENFIAGDPFAFDNIPLKEQNELVYLFGISAGSGGFTSGFGMWGATVTASNLGCKFKMGINPGFGGKYGGYFESMFLPMRLGVSRKTVEKVANKAWKNYRL